MNKEILNEPVFVNDIVKLIRSGCSDAELRAKLEDYHDNDIAESLEQLEPSERRRLFSILGTEWCSEVFAYVDDPKPYIKEFGAKQIAAFINEMDSDDAADILEMLDEGTQSEINSYLDEDVKADINLINSYDDDEIGSLITTNYIEIKKNLTIPEATQELIRQAGENDNISTIYVNDEDGKYCGTIDLKDLIIARKTDELDSIISYSYPYLLDKEKISDCIDRIKDYEEDSLPVLNSDKKLVGILTPQSVIEAVDDELGDDYAKLGGLTSEEDLRETTGESVKKRLPWLIVLLFLGMLVSTVVGAFEGVVAILPIVICFQSLILDMAGNVGTQSLAVTIRVLMDENLKGKDKLMLVVKEAKVGIGNGMLLGVMTVIFLGIYITVVKGYGWNEAFLISACVGISLLLAMVISSLVGTLVPMFFHKLNIDPAVASGPLITTLNDLVAVVTYYGLAWVFLIRMMNLA
ncbi:magnesium transporter [Oribacterium sp. P6A1]|uniref:magnesium transporter n=1 Tax=Oribacterium sp. P6A1 TaxID=1410612 RepID=UPI000691DBC5|nr:magnesium transporter [Oribacterium sp. P6A1]